MMAQKTPTGRTTRQMAGITFLQGKGLKTHEGTRKARRAVSNKARAVDGGVAHLLNGSRAIGYEQNVEHNKFVLFAFITIYDAAARFDHFAVMCGAVIY